MSVWLVVLVGLAVALASALLVGSARSASHVSGLIAFTREDGVYVMRPDGSAVRLLWRGSAGPTDVAWSPDGSKLAVSTSGRSVWIVNADGTDPVRVARVAALSLSWSADGRRIAFTRWSWADPDVWVMNADGSKMRLLKRTPKLWDSNVDWSPAGGRIAFDSGSYVPYVYVMKADGSGLHKVTPQRISGEQPDWSPDGRRIAYVNYDHEIWVMSANGQSQTGLTPQVGEAHPTWSPDGRKIAFSRGGLYSDTTGIYVMNADGTHVTRLTKNPGDRSPAWQPIGAP